MTDQESQIIATAYPVIRGHEGWELKVYRDTLGIPTIGVGFNLLNPDARELCESCGADYDALLSGSAELTATQCEWIYQQLALGVLGWLTLIFPAFYIYSQNRQIGLLDMGYNLGETRFRAFRMMISAVLAGDWEEASRQALDSLWARQVGARANDDAEWLANG